MLRQCPILFLMAKNVASSPEVATEVTITSSRVCLVGHTLWMYPGIYPGMINITSLAPGYPGLYLGMIKTTRSGIRVSLVFTRV